MTESDRIDLFALRKQLIVSTVLEKPMLDHERIELAMDAFAALLDGASMHRILAMISEPQPAVGVITPAALEGVSPPLSVFPSASAV